MLSVHLIYYSSSKRNLSAGFRRSVAERRRHVLCSEIASQLNWRERLSWENPHSILHTDDQRREEVKRSRHPFPLRIPQVANTGPNCSAEALYPNFKGWCAMRGTLLPRSTSEAFHAFPCLL